MSSTQARGIRRDSAQVLWIVRESAGKGQGVFATQDLPKGTLIMIDEPIGIIEKSCQDLTRHDVEQALEKMTPQQREQFMKLSSGGGTSSDELVKTYQTNAHGYGPDDTWGSICLDMAYINHSCRPNASWSHRRNVGVWIVIATHHIPKDTEITVAYVHFVRCYTRAQRDEIFRWVWGFSCACELCSLPPDSIELLASDMRRVLLLGLEIILDGKIGKVALQWMETTMRGSNGKMLCEVKPWLARTYNNARRTFAWFLVAKLQEAEGWFNESMGNAYMRAVENLQGRMIGHADLGRGVENVQAWFTNIKEWTKTSHDVAKVCLKHQGMTIYIAQTGEYPWKRDEKLSRDHFQLQLYDHKGEVVVETVSEMELVPHFQFENQADNFCRNFIKKYGHLYPTSDVDGDEGTGKVLVSRGMS